MVRNAVFIAFTAAIIKQYLISGFTHDDGYMICCDGCRYGLSALVR